MYKQTFYSDGILNEHIGGGSGVVGGDSGSRLKKTCLLHASFYVENWKKGNEQAKQKYLPWFSHIKQRVGIL
jgi:hypothetical protein